MEQYVKIPDGLCGEELRPYAEQILAAAAEASGDAVLGALRKLYTLSLHYGDAYDSPEPDLESRISRYLLEHRDYDDPNVMELIFASALIFPLPQVREIITGEADKIRNTEVLAYMERFWNEK